MEQQIPVAPYTLQLASIQRRIRVLVVAAVDPTRRPNLSAWLTALSDGDNYGNLS